MNYELKTTFYSDFSIADCYGFRAVKDTYKTTFNEWKHDYVYLTELVMVLNWKIWEHYEKNPKLAKLYNDLWQEADEYACNNLKDDELSYFYRTTD